MGLQKTLATSRLHWTNCGLVTSKKENNSVLLRVIVIGMINCFSSNEMLGMEHWEGGGDDRRREGAKQDFREKKPYCRVSDLSGPTTRGELIIKENKSF